LILANALYFKGAWNQKLDVSKTRFQRRDWNPTASISLEHELIDCLFEF
jgi:serine protease inhibitor